MQKIMPCLWFDSNAEEAMNFYVAAFSAAIPSLPSRVISIQRYPDEVPEEFMKGREGKVITGVFELAGFSFISVDGGPIFKFTSATSMTIQCHTEEEVNQLWQILSEGNHRVILPLDTYPFSPRYGWLEDKFGLSWQIILDEAKSENRVLPYLVFSGDKAEEAMRFYTEVFSNSGMGEIYRYGENESGDPADGIMHGEFTLEGQTFAASENAAPNQETFNEAISFQVDCKDQAEIDRLWEKLSVVPESEQCGWLKDKYGVSWQIVPVRLSEMMQDPDEAKTGRVMEALLKMKKIEIAGLEAAYNG